MTDLKKHPKVTGKKLTDQQRGVKVLSLAYMLLLKIKDMMLRMNMITTFTILNCS